MTETDPLLAAVEAPTVGTYEQEDQVERWIGVLPNGVEYYAADTLDGLIERETQHRADMRQIQDDVREFGGENRIYVPPPFTTVIHRVIRTVTTTTTTETRQPRPEETR